MKAKEWVNNQLITNNSRIEKLISMTTELKENLLKLEKEIKALEIENQDHRKDIGLLEGKRGVDF